MVKCLAQGHKHHGRGRDSNPHSDDSVIRTPIQFNKVHSNGAPLHLISSCLVHLHQFVTFFAIMECRFLKIRYIFI